MTSTSSFLPPWRRALPFFLGLVLLLGLASPFAWPQSDDGPTPQQQLDGLRQSLTQIETKLKGDADLDDTTLSRMKADALAAGAAADKLAVLLEPQLAGVQARLAELGKPAAGIKEAPDVAAQRSQLEHNSGTLDAQLKLARLLSVEADQTSELVAAARRQDLQERLGERTASILAGTFWTQLRAEFPQNVQRLRALAGEIGDAARYTDGKIWAGLVAAIAAVIVGWLWASRYLLRLTSTRVPAGRLRRSVHALVVALLSLIAPALVAELLRLGVCWDGTLADKTTAFLNGAVGIVGFGGFVAGLGHTLLSASRPSWRLLPLPDQLARCMRRFPATFAIAMVVVWTAEHLGALINVGLSTAVAVNCIVALLLVVTLALALLRAERAWRAVQQAQRANGAGGAAEAGAATAPWWLRAIVVLLWLALATSVVSLVIGYVAFGSFLAKQASWVIVIVSTTYLLAVLVDDVCMLLSTTPPDPNDEHAVLPTPKARDQAAVLLSGAGRTIVVLLAVMILLAPFGEGPAELVHRVGQLHDGLAIGEIQIRPAAVIQALLVLVFGFFGLRLLKSWMEHRYLPTTNLDAGMQMSVLTLFGYLGGIVAVALALSAVGIGLERIAWVASALSVGIGFGLQAVVQNFVSGLILLAERPVKVGDWVSLGGVEGDIRHINVRATEIQMGDRSTVIVPNSEFITKTVRNITLASPLGLVQIKLPLPLDTDPEAARELILSAFTDNTDVLDTPAPAVQLDGIDNGYLMFNATGFVSSPRLSYGVRSALLFELLKRLKQARMPVSKPSTMLLSTVAPAAAPAPETPAAPPPPMEAVAPSAGEKP